MSLTKRLCRLRSVCWRLPPFPSSFPVTSFQWWLFFVTIVFASSLHLHFPFQLLSEPEWGGDLYFLSQAVSLGFASPWPVPRPASQGEIERVLTGRCWQGQGRAAVEETSSLLSPSFSLFDSSSLFVLHSLSHLLFHPFCPFSFFVCLFVCWSLSSSPSLFILSLCLSPGLSFCLFFFDSPASGSAMPSISAVLCVFLSFLTCFWCQPPPSRPPCVTDFHLTKAPLYISPFSS